MHLTKQRLVRAFYMCSFLLISAFSGFQAFATGIGVAKNATVSGREIILDFYLESFSLVDVTSVTLTDDLDAAFGAGNYIIVSGPTFNDDPGTLNLNGGFDGSVDTSLVTSGSLAAGDTAQIRVTVEITTFSDQGLGLGVYSNQATVTGMDGGAKMDLSDAGTDPDPNGNDDPTDAGEDDPTIIDFFADPSVGVAKNAMLSGTQVTMDFYLEVFGNRDLASVSVIDDLDAVFGAGNYSIISAPVFLEDPGTLTLNAAFDGSANNDLISSGTLALGDTARIRVVVDVTTVSDQGMGIGVYSNQATANGASASGAMTSDLSANGIDPDANGNGNPNDASDNLPTPIVIGEEPNLGVAKNATVNNSVVTLDLYLENLGNVTVENMSLLDDLNATFGAGNFFISAAPSLVDNPGTLTFDASYDGNFNTNLLMPGVSNLAAGDTAQIQLQVTILNLADLGSGLGIYSNQATISGQAAGGGTTIDMSDDGTNPDPNGNGDPTEMGENDPTPITVMPIASIGISKEFVFTGLIGGFPNIELEFTVTNYGNQTVNNISISDDLNAVYGAGNYLHVTDPTYRGGSATFNYNTAFNGSTNTSMLLGGSLLAPGESSTFFIAHRLVNQVDQGFGIGIYQNQVTVIGTDPMANPVSDTSTEGPDPDPDGNGNPSEMDPTVIDVTVVAGIGIAKNVGVVGNVVTIDFYLENLGGINLSSVGFPDNLDTVFGAGNYSLAPATFIDDPGTLTLNPSYNGSDEQNILDIANSSLLAGDTAQVQLVVTVDNVTDQGLGFGNYTNQVTINGETPAGAFVTDISDFGTDPDPNGNGMANEAGENDTTPITISADTLIGAAKTAGVAGNVVTFDIFIESFGVSTLSDVEIEESLDTTFGAGNYTVTSAPALIVDPGTLVLNGSFDGSADTSILAAGSTLSAGATAQIQLVVTVDVESDQGSGFGIYTNQVTARGTLPGGTIVSDQSDDGTDPDPNGNGNPAEAGENDPTPIVIFGTPAIGVSKKATVVGTVVFFDFYVENLGDSTLTNITMEDELNPVFGSGNYSVTQQPAVVNGPGTILRSPQFFGFSVFDFVLVGGFLRPGEVEHIRLAVNITNITDQGLGSGIYDNGVTINATDPAGNPVSDVSDDGIDPDPNGNGNANEAGENDATRIDMNEEARIGAAKTASAVGQQVTMDFYLENFGTSALSSLSLTESLDGVFGAGNYTINSGPSFVDDPGTIVFNGGFDGSGDTELLNTAMSSLPATDTAQIQLVIDVTNVSDQGTGFGVYENQITVSGMAPSGSFTSDLSDSGTVPDPSGNGFANDANEDDPTRFTVGVTSIGAAKDATVNGNEVTFDFYIENFGTTTLTNVTLSEDLDAIFGAGNYTILSGPTRISAPRNLEANPNFDGSSDTALVMPGSIGLGVIEQIQLVVLVDTLVDNGSGLGVYTNQVTAMATSVSDLSDDGSDPDPNGNGDPTETGEDDPTVFTVVEDPVIGAAKTAAVTGTMATFNIYLEAFAGNVDLSSVTVIEDLDAVFGAGNYTITAAPSLIVDPGTLNLNGSFDGSGDNNILAAGSTLTVGSTAQIRLSVMVTNVTDQGFGSGMYQNQVTASAVGPGGTMTMDLSDDGNDADPNGNNDPTEAGEDDPSAFALEGSIGDRVFNDLNGNGVDDGEPGIAGVTVFLDTNSNGTLDMGEPSDTTDGAGAYDFLNLMAGAYDVNIDPATVTSGFVLTTANLPLTVNLTAGEDFNDADFGYQQQDASIGDYVFNDADGDGMDSGGKSGLAGIRVYLDLDNSGDRSVTEPTDVTDASGAYDIPNLPAGMYTVRVEPVTVPTGFNLTTANLPLVVNLAAGEDFNDADFGYQQQDASIGDLAYRDLNGNGVFDGGEPGQAGIVVYLDLNNNSMPDPGEPSAVSGGGGDYDITDLPAGNYTVRVDPSSIPVGFVLTSGNDPLPVTLAPGDDFNGADYGFQQQNATIGDFVWNDLDGDGVQDGGEPGLAGITVYLDLNTNGALDGGEPSSATDGSGAYDITGLATGTYSVRVDPTTVPVGFVLTGGTNPQIVILAAGEDFNDADFGYQQQDATIGDFVWNDLNGDGIQDGGEPGLAGVTVYLDLNMNGTLDGGEPSAVTDGSGAYDFTNLPTGTYSVQIDPTTVPTGYVFITLNLPLTVNLAAGEDFNDADFGYQRQDATIGDFVWNDLNGDGVQDGGEPGFDMVTIDLIDDANGNGMVDGGEAVLQTETTMGGGAYDFTGLSVGDYIVVVTDTNAVLTDYVLTGGVDPRPVSLVKGGDVNDADFGYQRQDGTIGDFVWNDLNGDGIQDGGEPGLDNVTLDLVEDTNGNGMIDGGEAVIQTQTTMGGGAYDFMDLPVGDYIVVVTDTNNALTNFILTGGTDPRPVSIAKSGDFNDADFGYQRADGTIGDFVWNDLNGDGVQDGGEPGLANVTLDLIDDANGNGVIDGGEAVLQTQTTSGTGAYDFTALRVGDYIVTVTDTNNVLDAYTLTGGVDPVAVSLTKSQDFNDADFGYQREDGVIGDFVWNDLNGDGVQDAGEPGFDMVTLDLIDDANGNGVIDAGEAVLDTQTTDAMGAYSFDTLTVGDYIVTVTDTNNVLDVYNLTGGVDPLAVALTKGQDFDAADFGYQREDGTIGDLVFNDFNSNGLQDPGEPGFENVTLDLIDDANGNGTVDAGEAVLDTQTTDAMGAYLFEGLTVGDYLVLVTDTNMVLDGLDLTGGADPFAVTLAKGESFLEADFGYLDNRARIGVSKDATATTLMITYNFQVENFGTVALTDLSMPEDLDAVFGAGVYLVVDGPVATGGNAVNASGNPSFDGSADTELFAPNSSLDVGEFIILSITIEITDPPQIVNGPISYTNQVTVSAVGPTGNPISDESTDGSFPDPDGNGDPRDNGTPTLVFLPLPVPTLGEWGLLAMVLGLIGAALWMRRRQQTQHS